MSRPDNIGVTAAAVTTSLPCLNLYATCRVAAPPAEAHCPRLAPIGPVGLDTHRRARFKRCMDKKKELPIGTTLSNKNQGQSGVQKSESKFLLTGGACNTDNFKIASIVRAKKILKNYHELKMSGNRCSAGTFNAFSYCLMVEK